MAKSLQRLNQVAKPDSFDDTKSASEISTSEIDSENFGQFLEAVISQIKRMIKGDMPGNWSDDPTEIFGSEMSLYGIAQCLSWNIVKNGQTKTIFADFDHVVKDITVENGGILIVENGGRLVCVGG